jgi:transposase InsO family protein
VELVVAKHGVSERLACRVLGQHRSTQRKKPTRPDDEVALTADITSLATQYGRYGYRRITAMLRQRGWRVRAKRVARIWRREWGEADKAILPVKGWPAERFQANNRNVGDYGSTMDLASDCDLSIRTMSGLMTL